MMYILPNMLNLNSVEVTDDGRKNGMIELQATG